MNYINVMMIQICNAQEKDLHMTCLYPNCDARDDENENKLAQFFNLTFDYTDDVLKYFHTW